MKAKTQQYLPINYRVAQIDLSKVFRQLTQSVPPCISAEDWPAAELEYRRFLTLTERHPHQLLIPGGRCLRIWQAHILNTRAYREACYTTFGRVIDHFPYLGLGDSDDRSELAAAKRAYRRAYRQCFVQPSGPATTDPSNSDLGDPVEDHSTGRRNGVHRLTHCIRERDAVQEAANPEIALHSAKICRRVVLVALAWQQGEDRQMPLGHASLMAALDGLENLEVHSIVRSVNGAGFTPTQVASEIQLAVSGVPDQSVSVALGAYVWNDDAVREVLQALRNRGYRGRIILGGPQITYMTERPEQVYPEVDVFIRGQGESVLRQLVEQFGHPDLQGVHYAGTTYSGAQAVAAFNNLPSPWLSGVLEVRRESRIRWETQRGCNFRCSFCQHRQPGKKNQIVRRVMDRLEQEIDLFCDVKARRISVLDPVFNADDDHATSVLQAFVDRGFEGEISLQCRAEFVTERFLDTAEKLNVCLEFGLQSIHLKECAAIGRRNHIKEVERILSEVKRRDIRHEVSLIYGLPEQTLASFGETVAWCLARQINVIKAFPLLLLRGTPLEAERERWRFSVKSEGLPMVTESESFSAGDWLKMDRIANALARTEGRHPTTFEALLGEPGGAFDANAASVRALGRG